MSRRGSGARNALLPQAACTAANRLRHTGVKTVQRRSFAIGKELWDRYWAAKTEAVQREALLRYLIDRGDAISTETKAEMVDKAVSAKMVEHDAAQDIRSIALKNGATGAPGETLQIGPSQYIITIKFGGI